MKKNNHTQIRQGDVLIRSVEKTTIGKAAKREGGNIILAHGEVTGHAHAIAAPRVRKSEETAINRDGQLLVSQLEIDEAMAELRHEEHATAKLPAGNFEVIRQREYSPAEIRNVAD